MENAVYNNEKYLLQLKNTYKMYENTKKETRMRMKDTLNSDGTRRFTDADIENKIGLISKGQEDIVAQYRAAGGDVTELGIQADKANSAPKESFDEWMVNEMNKAQQQVAETNRKEQAAFKSAKVEFEERDAERKRILDEQISATATKLEQEYIPTKGTYNPEEAFDVIPLPSKGEGYKEKISKASVAYLTAYDENMIVSPNLYKDNLILDYIIQEKLLSKEVQPMDLLEGDREAIILFLRATGYGNEYPITATDNATGKEFEAMVDLSKLKYKEFNLKGDTNGWFSFTLPVSKKEIKFRFPTHRDTVLLEKMANAEDDKIKKENINEYVSVLDSFLEEDKILDKDDKIKTRQAIRTIEKWANKIDNENGIKFNHTLTNRLSLLIMAVDGITDKKYISEFVRNMNVRDSSALRKYMAKNEPGVDYTITIERPEELGGGSMTTFLQFDKFLFLNIAE